MEWHRDTQSTPQDEKLCAEITEAAEKYAGDFDSMFYRMAFCVIRHCLGEDWVTQNVRLQTRANDFMLNEFDEESDNRFLHMKRVVTLGDKLFILKGVLVGFDDLCAKLKQRSLRSCYFEVFIAANLVKLGFDVTVVKETGSRGEDFDFLARREGQEISVEVTAKDDIQFSVQSLRNTLRKKRTQVPPTQPAVLCLVVPDRWTTESDAETLFSSVVKKFFSASRRYNAVIIYWTAAIPIDTGMFFAEVSRTYWNPDPRNPLLFENERLLETAKHGLRSIADARASIAENGQDFVKALPGRYGIYPSFYGG